MSITRKTTPANRSSPIRRNGSPVVRHAKANIRAAELQQLATLFQGITRSFRRQVCIHEIRPDSMLSILAVIFRSAHIHPRPASRIMAKDDRGTSRRQPPGPPWRPRRVKAMFPATECPSVHWNRWWHRTPWLTGGPLCYDPWSRARYPLHDTTYFCPVCGGGEQWTCDCAICNFPKTLSVLRPENSPEVARKRSRCASSQSDGE